MKIRDKVLIVEDEQNIKNFMSTILTANGFDTLMAGGAKEALYCNQWKYQIPQKSKQTDKSGI